jgi:pentose-5-phosphate-3-epimerase|tara:strand:- start:754 stop:927 length:174 start_codon:yes stop_codon:yes gene_type:complete
MNNEIKEHLYEYIDLCVRAIKFHSENDEHYKTLLSLINHRGYEYQKDYATFLKEEEE